MLIIDNDFMALKFKKMLDEQKDIRTQKRVLTTIGTKKCPWGCIYCFVDNENYPGLNRIDIPNAEEVYQLTDKCVSIIQPAADVEISLVSGYTDLLDKLSELGKHISFSTKAKLTKTKLDELKRINEKLIKKGSILQIAVSILKIDDWQEIEVRTPSPFERIETLRNLFESGIPTSVAFRPLLPFINPREIKEIVELTHNYTYAYLTGPVYLTPALKKYMLHKGYYYDIERKRVNWIPDNPEMELVQSPELEKELIRMADKYSIPVFKNNIDLVRYLGEKFTS